MWVFGFILVIAVFVIMAINHENRKKDENEWFKNLKTKTEQLQKENEYNAIIFEYYREHVNNGKRYESDKNYEKAIEQYRLGLDYAVKEPTLKINNFSKSIHRLIILYGKTNQYEDLKNLLEESISNYPDYRDVGDWKTRLEKLNTKLNNQ